MTDEPLHTFPSIWEALAETPEEAATMRRRADLALAIRGVVEAWGQSQSQAAARLGVTQPRLNELLRRRLERFSLDTPMALAERAGLAVKMRISVAAE
jgi:predicted XRE-type DNA-binding protein